MNRKRSQQNIPRGGVISAVYRRKQPKALTLADVRNVISKASRPKVGNNPTFLAGVTDDVTNAMKKVVNESTFVALVVMVVVLTAGHAGDIDTGPLAPLFPKDSKNAFVIWVRANVAKFFGALYFVPTVAALPESSRILVVCAAASWIFLAPPFTAFEYGIQSLLVYLYFNVKQKNTRFCIVGVVGAIFFFELMGKTPAPIVAPPPGGVPTFPTTQTPARKARSNEEPEFGRDRLKEAIEAIERSELRQDHQENVKASIHGPSDGPNLGKMLKRPIHHESEEFIKSPHPHEVPVHPKKKQ